MNRSLQQDTVVLLQAWLQGQSSKPNYVCAMNDIAKPTLSRRISFFTLTNITPAKYICVHLCGPGSRGFSLFS